MLVYDQPYHPSQYPQGRPDSHGGGKRQDYRVSQVYGWKPSIFEQPGYAAFPSPANAYLGQISQDPAGVPVPYGRTTPPGASGLGPQQQKQPQRYSDLNVSSPYGPVSVPPAAASIPQ
jgi:signal transducing adaptor molecule